MTRFVLPLVAFLALIVFFAIGLHRDDKETIPSPFINQPAPTFSLPALKDPERVVGTGDFAGRMVLVNVWATWCVGCRQEHDFLMELAASGPLPIIGINWRDNRTDALGWLQALGDPYEFSAFDEDARVGIDWGVYGAPETFLISADGVVLQKYMGPLDQSIWESEFLPFITSGG